MDALEQQLQDEPRRAELRARFVERSLSGEGFDLDAALEVRDRGWTH